LEAGADEHALVVLANISSICAGAPSSTMYLFWLVPNNSLLSFRRLRDFSTGSLDRALSLSCSNDAVYRTITMEIAMGKKMRQEEALGSPKLRKPLTRLISCR
jgi:hypothetical protein